MALHKVEEVFVGNTVTPDTGLFQGSNSIATIMASGSWTSGDWGIINADTNVSLNLSAWATPTPPTWPAAIKFMFYDATRTARFSQRIEQGSLSRYISQAYVLPTPIAYRYDFTNLVSTAKTGDKVWLTITLKNEFEFKMHKRMIEHTFFVDGSQSDVDALANKINEAITEMFPNFYPAKAHTDNVGVEFGQNGTNQLILTTGRPQSDQTNINQVNIYDVDVSFTGCYIALTNTTHYNWGPIGFVSTDISRGSIASPVYNGLNELTSASGNFTTTDAVNGSGTVSQVTSHYWRALGQLGHLNRVMFESTPYNPILGSTYDCFVFTHEGSVRMGGESPERTNQPKQITVYLPNTTPGTVDADSHAIFTDLYNNYK